MPVTLDVPNLGSPPRMRGIPTNPACTASCSGITPAHAGNTPRRYIAVLLNRDHPRACGEYEPWPGRALPQPGSPPRMRGIPFSTLTAEILQRITPAHAGNTYKDKAQDYVLRDHPRACGEYSAHGIRQCRYGGSPPRMRGIRFQGDNHLSQHGITPAHAGNTCRLLWQVGQCQDHPRACGEYSDAGLTQKASAGSPPRMRGIHKFLANVRHEAGITPAHAGNT